ncbi:MAG TPA: CHRD domain-containing protein [Gemmatimonadaceae bacterium]|nr:CHRD domain-containing protein [Gemmatimonadaceae bacterium]
MRRLTPLFMLALAACADGATSPTEMPNLARIQEAEDSHGGTPFMAVLLPGTEVPIPPGGDPNPAAGGVAFVTLNSGQEEICVDVSFGNLSAPLSDSHIHFAPEGVRGGIVVPFQPAGEPALPKATSGEFARCVFASRELIKAIRDNPQDYYVNIHTRSTPANALTDRPGGAIRGQLQPVQGSEVNQS